MDMGSSAVPAAKEGLFLVKEFCISSVIRDPEWWEEAT